MPSVGLSHNGYGAALFAMNGKTMETLANSMSELFFQRTLRVLVMHMTYSTQQEKKQIQKYLFGVVEAVLAKCADSNRSVS